jgi:hypothetical protein
MVQRQRDADARKHPRANRASRPGSTAGISSLFQR